VRNPAATGSSRASLAARIACVLAAACGAPEQIARPAVSLPPRSGVDFPSEERSLLRYRSARFELSVALPDGRAWKIDDHHERALIARHAPTRSTLTVLTFTDPDLMNRQKCQERAVTMGLLALHDPRTLEDATTVGPGAFDSRVWIAVEAGPTAGAPITGHAVLVGGSIRKCLFVHYATEVASVNDEPLLTSRLAVARLRILAGVQIESFDVAPREPARVP